MFLSKLLFRTIVLLSCCVSSDVISLPNLLGRSDTSDQESVLLQKPRWFQRGEYKHGHYIQLTFDEKAFWGSMLAGGLSRTLVSIALCGNKLDSFKTAVLRPGITKSLLFWIPSFVAYKVIIDGKEKRSLFQRLEKTNHQYAPTALDPFGQNPLSYEDESRGS